MRWIPTTVTYLEMLAPPGGAEAEPPEAGLSVRRWPRPRVEEYLPLYDGVGRDLCWTERKLMAPERLQWILDDPALEVWVLSAEAGDGSNPLGYFELDRHDPHDVQLAYFGLFAAARGRRLGPFLLDRAIRTAWEAEPIPRRVWVHTCTLDDPRALPLYQRAGFVPYDTSVEKVTLLDE